MEPVVSPGELKKFNVAQLREINKCCKTDREIIDWINKNSQRFRERYYMKKKWYVSKTVIFNVLTIAILILQHFADAKVLDPELVATAIAVINLILRKFTTKGI